MTPLLCRRHPGGLGGTLPDLPECRRRGANCGVELTERHAPPPFAFWSVRGSRAKDDFPPDLVSQIQCLGRVGQVSLISKNVSRGSNIADDSRRSLVGAEILGGHGVQRGAELCR